MPLISAPPNATGCCGEAVGATATAAVARKSCCAETPGSTGPSFDVVLQDAGGALAASAQRRDARASAAAFATTEATTAARLLARAATHQA